jgi:hypothetical protein
MLNIPRNIKYLMIILFILILFLGVFLFSQQSKEKPSTIPTKIVQQSTTKAPAGSLKIVSVEGNTDLINVDGKITINFNQAVEPQTLNIIIMPEERLLTTLSPDGRSLLVEPETVWHNNTEYKISISNSLKGTQRENF